MKTNSSLPQVVWAKFNFLGNQKGAVGLFAQWDQTLC